MKVANSNLVKTADYTEKSQLGARSRLRSGACSFQRDRREFPQIDFSVKKDLIYINAGPGHLGKAGIGYGLHMRPNARVYRHPMEDKLKRPTFSSRPFLTSINFAVSFLLSSTAGASCTTTRSVRKIFEDIVFLSFVRIRVILVHGGGPNISNRLKEMGIVPEFHNGIRVTDAKTLEVVIRSWMRSMTKIVKELKALGGDADRFGWDEHIIPGSKEGSLTATWVMSGRSPISSSSGCPGVSAWGGSRSWRL